MTKIVNAADVCQGYNQTRSGNLWRFLPQRVGSAGLIRRKYWGGVRWLGRAGPLSLFTFFIHFIRSIGKQKTIWLLVAALTTPLLEAIRIG